MSIQPGDTPSESRRERPEARQRRPMGEPPNQRRTPPPPPESLRPPPPPQMEPIDLSPDEDFGPEAAFRREIAFQTDAADAYRQLNRKSIEEHQKENKLQELGISPFAAVPMSSVYQERARDLLRSEASRRKASPNLESFPAIKDLIAMGEEQGLEFTSKDIKNLVEFGVVNAAADRIIAATQVGDRTSVNNVYLTLQETNPIMAAILPEVIEEKLTEAVTDPTIVQRMMAQAMESIGFLLSPLIALNEGAQHRYRAAQWNLDQNEDSEFAWRHLLYGMFSNDAIDATGHDQLNESYIKEIIASGNYTELEIQIALDVFRASIEGDPDAIVNVWQEKYPDDEEAAPLFRDLIYRRPRGNMQELMRQIDSAYLGNTGQVAFGAGRPDAEYQRVRGYSYRQDLANATGFGISFVVDPTLFTFAAIRMVQSVKYNLMRLAPGSKESASEVIRKVRFGRIEFSNPVYRYFDSFSRELNRLDDLERAAKAAKGAEKTKATQVYKDALEDVAERYAAFGAVRTVGDDAMASQAQRIGRQFDEMPQDIIMEFRKTARDADGKFSPEAIAAVIDDMNDAYLISMNQISERLAVLGATRNALDDALIEARKLPTSSAEDIAKIEDEIREVTRLTTKTERELVEHGRTSFVARVASANEKPRRLLLPRETLAASIRKDAVNRLAYTLMPKAKAAKLADDHLADPANPRLFAQALSDNAIPFGVDARSYKRSLEGATDVVGRMFSSIPSNNRISVTSAKDATNVYRYARMFFPKRTSELIAEAFRRGDEGSRRLLLSGLIRSAAASRGFTMTVQDGDKFVKVLTPKANDLVTGTIRGEKYGVSVPTGLKPSERAAALKSGRNVDEESGTMLRSLSADENGIEHAMHLSQTADSVVLPTIKQFEELRGAIQGRAGSLADHVTNWWSALTLYGLRFAMRNAIEEVGLYWLTGGRFLDLYRGRKMDQALRRVRPHITIQNIDGKATPVYKPSLGMFASRANKISVWMKHKGFPEWSADLIFRGIDNQALEAANIALAQGKTTAFAELAVRSLATQRVFGFGPRTNLLRKDDEIAFKYLADSTHGLSLLDEIGQSANYLQSGGFPIYMAGTRGIGETPPGVEYGKLPQIRYGDYTNIKPALRNANQQEVYGSSFWWRELQTTIDGDGPIGEAAVLYLTNPAVGKAEIARIIREDKTFRYKERLSRLRSDADIERFADDYFENVFQHFTKADGSLNLNLRAKFIETDKTGKQSVVWWKVADEETGALTPRVSSSDLMDYAPSDRPDYIFGREVSREVFVPMPVNEASLLSAERIYPWMGAQNARISREPIFLSHYIDQFSQTATARAMMANAMAKRRAGAGAKPTDSEIELANKVYAEISMDNAASLTLSYVDNPANRSNLAWKARNISRYYRASEDFYRRIKRTLVNNPEAAWKGALTYQLLGDYGFTYRDDQGEMYFAYPGNRQLQHVAANIAGYFWDIPMQQYVDLQPFSINGRLLGVAPSTDPNQFLPSLMGPLTMPVAAVYGAFPALAGLRAITLGPFSQGTGDPLADAVRALIPAGVAKALAGLNPDEFDASVAQAGLDAIAVMMAEGMLDEFTVNGKPLTDAEGNPIEPSLVDKSQFKLTDQYRAAQIMATIVVVSKIVGGYTIPAAPRIGRNTASEFAKEHGIDDMNNLFREILERRQDDPNPMQSALSEFMRLQSPSMRPDSPYAGWDTMLPFTVGRYKDDPEAGSRALAAVQAGDQLVGWLRDSKTKDLESKYNDVYLFLAPRGGEFTWESWNILLNVLNTKVLKTENDRLGDMFAINGQVNENIIRASYEEQLASAPSPDRAEELVEEMNVQIQMNRDANPYLRRAKETQNPIFASTSINTVLYRVRDMLSYIEKEYGSLSSDEMMMQNAINIYQDYKGRIAGLQGTAQQRSAEKKRQIAEMEVQLSMIKEESENAKRFIEAVIQQDPDYSFGVR